MFLAGQKTERGACWAAAKRPQEQRGVGAGKFTVLSLTSRHFWSSPIISITIYQLLAQIKKATNWIWFLKEFLFSWDYASHAQTFRGSMVNAKMIIKDGKL